MRNINFRQLETKNPLQNSYFVTSKTRIVYKRFEFIIFSKTRKFFLKRKLFVGKMLSWKKNIDIQRELTIVLLKNSFFESNQTTKKNLKLVIAIEICFFSLINLLHECKLQRAFWIMGILPQDSFKFDSAAVFLIQIESFKIDLRQSVFGLVSQFEWYFCLERIPPTSGQRQTRYNH